MTSPVSRRSIAGTFGSKPRLKPEETSLDDILVKAGLAQKVDGVIIFDSKTFGRETTGMPCDTNPADIIKARFLVACSLLKQSNPEIGGLDRLTAETAAQLTDMKMFSGRERAQRARNIIQKIKDACQIGQSK